MTRFPYRPADEASAQPESMLAAQPESVLVEAERIINGQRAIDYGDTLDSFTRIGQLWSPVLGVEVTAEQVALCMVGLKVARAMNGYHRDSIVDIAGYAGCLERIQSQRQRGG